ncbi:MAG: bacillithiol biosynthesis deacetylase BshB1 [Cyclobacteriaceae bacterium]|nr:bacillithiol biosynthesis deacetylase BshB1 [Cyclobacteriaceae bacterium HetDA_MAG_MS6]
MKLDILAIAAHPDDVELSCSGTLITQIRKGNSVGIIDLTKGEMGTRGTPEQRLQEANDAGKLIGVSVRENLGFDDAFFSNDKDHQLEIIRMIRKYQPDIVLANAPYDRHPDHGRASTLVEEAFFKAGLVKIETTDRDLSQEPWRPKRLFHYIQSVTLEPNFIVDVSAVHEQKMKAILAFKSQFHDPGSEEPETYISSPAFLEMIASRSREFGHRIGVQHGEGFIAKQVLGISDLNTVT